MNETKKAKGMTEVLPIECISKIISFMTQKKARRLSLVSRLFKEAADSNVAWESFLPSDWRQIVAQSPGLNSLSLKQLYHSLHLSSWSDDESEKKGCTLSARSLDISRREGDPPEYWEYISAPPGSRFPQVAKLSDGCSLEVRGRLRTQILSPRTPYGVFFIFKFEKKPLLRFELLDWKVELEGSIELPKRVIFRRSADGVTADGVTRREDGWMELEMWRFFNENGDKVVQYKLWETYPRLCNSGLVIEGVEFRPA